MLVVSDPCKGAVVAGAVAVLPLVGILGLLVAEACRVRAELRGNPGSSTGAGGVVVDEGVRGPLLGAAAPTTQSSGRE